MKPHPSVHHRRVLVIDDEASFTRMVQLNLEATGNYHVEVVNESPKAYEVAKRFRPDIILLDVVMPEADGGDVANAIRQHADTAKIPIIFVSAMVSPKESSNGFYNSGGEHFLAKPVNKQRLLDAIEKVVMKDS
ncbi:MAG: response regulator [Verrucomicrobiota bacterium]